VEFVACEFAKVNVRERGNRRSRRRFPANPVRRGAALLDQEPANVQVPLPIRKLRRRIVIDVSPEIATSDATPDPSRTEEPERVSVPVAVRPAFEEAPIEMIPAAWIMSPLTARSNDPIAIVRSTGRVERSRGHIQINRGGSASGVRVKEDRIRRVRHGASIHPPTNPPSGPSGTSYPSRRSNIDCPRKAM